LVIRLALADRLGNGRDMPSIEMRISSHRPELLSFLVIEHSHILRLASSTGGNLRKITEFMREIVWMTKI
jgi:hypothetical protein